MFLKNRQRGNHVHRPLQYCVLQIFVRIASLLPDIEVGIGPRDEGGFVKMRALAFEYKRRETALDTQGKDLMLLRGRQFHRQIRFHCAGKKRLPTWGDDFTDRNPQYFSTRKWKV